MTADTRVATVRAELRSDSPFVATSTPRLTWRTETTTPDWVQAGAEVTDGGATVTLEGAESSLVTWPFVPLAPGERREVRVRVRGVDGVTTDWSDPLAVEAGFLAPDEWVAEPIGLADPEREAQPALVRKTFHLDRTVRRAVLLWTALGSAEPEINGHAVSDDVLAPGWTATRDRLVHESVDVTDLLVVGDNVVGATLAGAWYTERYGFFTFTDRIYGDQPAFLAQLRVTFDDGTVETVAPTGAAWTASGETEIVTSGIYAGEHQDLRLRAPWSTPDAVASGDERGWAPARVGVVARPGYENVPVPEARIAEPVRRHESLPVRARLATPSGGEVLDFGQNLVGRLRLRVSGAAGTIVTIRHAEVLDEDELALRPLRNATATASFVLSGGDDVLESRFSFYGFRYAQVTGIDVDDAGVEAVVLHSDMERTGWFSSSHEMLDRLHENVVWGMRGNFLALPTDCPQRDERLGWTGDLQVFAPTASFLYDCDGFLTSWLRDLALEQERVGGIVPLVIPAALPSFAGGGPVAAWGDAATVTPTVLHERFGDREVLAAQYPSMRAWADAVRADAGESGLWAGRMQLGDWLDPSAPPDQPGKAKVDGDIVATAYFARSLRQVSEAAALLGYDDDATTYAELAERSRAAFVAEYVTPAGRMMSDAPTAYALALAFELVRDTETRAALADRLAALVRESGYRISTGFVGTPIIADALSDGGHHDAAERLLLQTQCPSWLYPVTQGATTVWERWDSLLPDGSVNPGEMTSFNHYALGAVADWLHRTVAGLAPAVPGYRRLRIAPRPLAALERASARHRTPYGLAEVSWEREPGTDVVRIRATVPPNTTAEVVLPGVLVEGTAPAEVGSGAHEWRVTVPPAPPRPPLPGLEAMLADVIDDPRAYAALIEALEETAPERVEAVRSGTVWGAGRPLASALMFTPPHVLERVDRAVRDATA
ncbi:MAG: family 78 glycoside hydrolase catalytic domain [Microbacterium enclense]